jgi:hypothetical protein
LPPQRRSSFRRCNKKAGLARPFCCLNYYHENEIVRFIRADTALI